MRRNVTASLLLFLTLFIGMAQSVQAENKTRSVNVDVALDSLGNAHITETWEVNIDSDNTEWYLAKYNLGCGRIHDLSVTDTLTSETYITEDQWNVNRSREAKKGRCGIVDKGGASYEICWGVGSNGPHVWQVSYTQDNLVRCFSDSCAFNHMFVSDGLSSPPVDVAVTIRYPGLALTDSIASAWAFNFYGVVSYVDSTIVVKSEQPLGKKDGVTVMVAFDRGIFDIENFDPVAVHEERPFSKMKEEAFAGSDYKEPGFWRKLLNTLIVIAVILLVILLYYAGPLLAIAGFWALFATVIPFLWGIVSLYPLRMLIRRRRCFKDGSTWRRDIPKSGDLAHVPQIMSHYSFNILSKPEAWDNELTAAYIMKLIYDGAFGIHKEVGENGKTKAMLEVNMGWKGPKDSVGADDAAAMKSLYDIIKRASGRDLILQDGELKEWKKKSGESSIRAFYKLRQHEGFKVTNEESCEILGLYNYLKDFSLAKERGVMEVALWDQYLVYATAFGIGDKVMKEMKKMAPDYFTLSKTSQFLDDAGEFALNVNALCDMSSRIRASEPSSTSSTSSFSGGGGGNSFGGYTSRSSGGGGYSSYSGGGGHTGGGGGGGR